MSKLVHHLETIVEKEVNNLKPKDFIPLYGVYNFANRFLKENHSETNLSYFIKSNIIAAYNGAVAVTAYNVINYLINKF